MHVRRKPHRIYDPQLRDAEPGVERGLAPEIVAQTRIANLDDEPRRLRREAADAARLRIEDETGFEISCSSTTLPEQRPGLSVNGNEAAPSSWLISAPYLRRVSHVSPR